MTEEKIKAALLKVSAEGVPSVRVSGAECVLVYGADAYEKRVGADFAAISAMCAVVSSSVVETLAKSSRPDDLAVATAQTMTLVLRPLPEKR